MSRYRRSVATGATFFFTVNLADRRSRLLIDEIDRLRHAFRHTKSRHPFETIAICVLPDHLHAAWRLSQDDNRRKYAEILVKSIKISQYNQCVV